VGGKLANIVGKGADANPVSAIADIDTSGVRMLDRQSRRLGGLLGHACGLFEGTTPRRACWERP
jgi:hypothetical protein